MLSRWVSRTILGRMRIFIRIRMSYHFRMIFKISIRSWKPLLINLSILLKKVILLRCGTNRKVKGKLLNWNIIQSHSKRHYLKTVNSSPIYQDSFQKIKEIQNQNKKQRLRHHINFLIMIFVLELKFCWRNRLLCLRLEKNLEFHQEQWRSYMLSINYMENWYQLRGVRVVLDKLCKNWKSIQLCNKSWRN